MCNRGIPSGGVYQWRSVHRSVDYQALDAILINLCSILNLSFELRGRLWWPERFIRTIQ